jgi:spore coat protein U-like protein
MKMSNRKLVIRAALAMAAGLGIASSSWAATATSNMNVSAAVVQTCTITASPTLNFGTYDPISANASSPLAGTSTVSVKCTKGSSGITVDIGNGLHAVSTQRNMLGGTSGDSLAYNITQPATTTPYTSCAGSTVWGSAAAGSVYTPTVVAWGTTPLTFTVCGSVPAGQNVGIDASYADTVQVSVAF